MPSFQDSALIFVLALLLFGPKKLPELARQLGKLMGEFRRASNDFRMQMEDELRMSDQADRQKKIAEMEAAAPAAPLLGSGDEYPVTDPPAAETAVEAAAEETAEVLPIATEGDLKMMPPDTGLPVARESTHRGEDALGPLLEAIPEAPAEGHVGVDHHG